MDNLEKQCNSDGNSIKITKEEYNAVPVFYCKQCLSLLVLSINDSDYCDKCGSTDIGVCSIEDWEELYFKKYKHKFRK